LNPVSQTRVEKVIAGRQEKIRRLKTDTTDMPAPKLDKVNKNRLKKARKQQGRTGMYSFILQKRNQFDRTCLRAMRNPNNPSFRITECFNLSRRFVFFPAVRTENDLCDKLESSMEGLGSKGDGKDYDFAVDFK
jgi:hypothetical protein